MELGEDFIYDNFGFQTTYIKVFKENIHKFFNYIRKTTKQIESRNRYNVCPHISKDAEEPLF